MTDSPDTVEALLAHRRWVYALARRLVTDETVAEDLTQEVCVRALEYPGSPRRAWLATVVKNLVRQWRREQFHRAGRERASARREGVRSTDEVVLEAAQHRRLVEAVFELHEPYRTTVLLRYFEDLPPRAIAERMCVPVSSVKTRLQRGVQQLRDRLDREFGDRRSWIAVLSPLACRPSSGHAVSIGAGLMNLKVVGVIGALILGCLLVLIDRGGVARDLDGDGVARANPVDPDHLPQTDATTARAEPGVGRAPVAALPPVDGAAGSEERATWTIRGRVLGADGLPLRGLDVLASGGSGRASSGSGGWFTLEVDRPTAELECGSEGWVTLSKGLFREGLSIEPVVVVAPTVNIAGNVVDSNGAALDGVDVRSVLPPEFFTRFERPLSNSSMQWWSAKTRGGGRFELECHPAIEGAELQAYAVGYELGRVPLPTRDATGVTITLARPTATVAGSLRGVVLGPEGRRVEGAWVSLGLTTEITDADGEFSIDLARAVLPRRITAAYPGFSPAVRELGETPDGGPPPDLVELRLGPTPLAIEGFVHTKGEPRAGIQVWISDPTPLGPIGRTPLALESVLAGAEVQAELLGAADSLPAEDGARSWRQAREIDTPNATFHWATTDARGRFRLEGLLGRSYRLKAFDPETLLAVERDGIPAGAAGVDLELPAGSTFPVVSGRAVDGRGRPVPGLSLLLFHEAYQARSRVFGGRQELRVWRTGQRTTTDSDGRFSLERVPRDGVTLWFTGDSSVSLEYPLRDPDDPLALEVEIEVRYHFRVELAPPVDRASSIGVRDGRGVPVPLMDLRPNNQDVRQRFEIEGGRSATLSVGAEATHVVFFSGDAAVGEAPLALDPTGITVVDW